MNVTIIGLGLIGGSLSIALRKKGIATFIYGVESNPSHAAKAMELGLANEITDLETAVTHSELIILALPVRAALNILPGILELATNQVIMDVGSTKSAICQLASTSPKGSRFVPTHPMWGTEYSGPDAAVDGAFTDKAVVICESESIDPAALEMVEKIYKQLGMHLLYMDAASHDVHAAYISHISHISSFALANTVLEKEKEDEAIFEMASGGFESTVRLAKSNVDMWVPIFLENKENILDVLNEHISQLRKFKACLEKENGAYLADLINQANKIKRIIR